METVGVNADLTAEAQFGANHQNCSSENPGDRSSHNIYVWHVQILASGCITASSAGGQLMLHRCRSRNPRWSNEAWVWLRCGPSAKRPEGSQKNPNLHGRAPHSQRPGAQPARLESRESKRKLRLFFWSTTNISSRFKPQCGEKDKKPHSGRGGKQSRENARVLHYL